jgi:two-component system, OmpR family, sensor kinase
LPAISMPWRSGFRSLSARATVFFMTSRTSYARHWRGCDWRRTCCAAIPAASTPRRLDASLDRIDREAGQLDALVGELLTLARLESDAGRSEEYFDLLEVLRLVTDDAQFEAEAQSVTLNVGLPTDSADDDWLILGSGQLVHRAFENSLRNALRFSSQGFAVGLTLERDGADCCIVTVDDEGPGIADGEATRLLEPFVQGAHRRGMGFGLGLGIARRAIAASGGSVTLANSAGGGLRVTIALPLARGALNQFQF